MSPVVGTARDDRAPNAMPQDPEVIRQQSADDSKGLLSDESWTEYLKPKKMAATLRQKTPWKRDEEKARRALQEGDELYREKKYEKAIPKYKTAAFRWPDSIIEEDALFMLGECYFFRDRYPKASDTYAKLLKKYSNSRHLEKVVARQFATARYWEQLQQAQPKMAMSPNLTDKSRPMWDTTTHALACYQTVWLNDPTSPLADDAVMATANSYFLQGKFQDADFHYTQLRQSHTKSEHLVDAYKLGLRAKLKTYQGPVYESVPLQQSDEMTEQMLLQFPTELGDDRDRVLATRREIRELYAERYWEMAQYYAKNKYYGATRYYCDQILDEYPDTSFASRAEEQKQEIAGRPDNPKSKLKWFLDLIPLRERE